jgi:phage shock protein PspC (stress-responsive transcriptional regulator)
MAHDDPMSERKRPERSSTDKYVAGVCGGLGRSFDLDPVLFRVAFGVSIVFGGLGLVAYIALALFLPKDDGTPAFMEGRSRAFTLIAAGCLAVSAVGAFHPPSFVFGPALVIIAALAGVGVLLYRMLGGRAGEDPARIAARATLVAIVLIASLGAATGVGMIAALGGGVAEAVLAVLAGFGLIAAGLLGGPRWLMLPVIVFVMPLAVVTAANLNLRGGVGQRHYAPATVAQLRPQYRIGAGQIDLDLRRLDVPEGRTDVNLRVGLGEAIVRAPDGACIATDARIGAGRAEVPDHAGQGFDVEVSAPARAARIVHVQASVGVGRLQVEGACA